MSTPATRSRSKAVDFDFLRVLAEAKSGSPAALAMLYRKFNPPLQRSLVWQEPRDGEDLAADVWVAVAPKINEFTGDARAFRAWLFTFGRRRLIDHVRRDGRGVVVPLLATSDSASQDDPEREALARVYTTEAAELLNLQLTSDQRNVLMLRIYRGLNTSEAASLMGHTDTWVRVTQHRALQRLRQQLDTDVRTLPQSSPRQCATPRRESSPTPDPAIVTS